MHHFTLCVDLFGTHSTLPTQFAQPVPPTPTSVAAIAPVSSALTSQVPPFSMPLPPNRQGVRESHVRTTSAASSYNSVPAAGNNSVPSVTSTDSLPTPNTTNLPNMPWQSQPKHNASGSSSRSVSGAPGHPNISLVQSGVLDRAWYAAGSRSRTGPLRSPIRDIAFNPRAASPPLRLASHGPDLQTDVLLAPPAASARVALGTSTGDGVPELDSQQPVIHHLYDNVEPEPQPQLVLRGPTSSSSRLRPGGQPFISPDEFDRYAKNPPKSYRMHEYRLLVTHFFDPDAPLDLFEQALVPLNRSTRDVFLEVSIKQFSTRWLLIVVVSNLALERCFPKGA